MNDKVEDLSYTEMQEIVDAAWNCELLHSQGRSLKDYLTAAYLPQDRRGTREYGCSSDYLGFDGASQDARQHLEAAICEALRVYQSLVNNSEEA